MTMSFRLLAVASAVAAFLVLGAGTATAKPPSAFDETLDSVADGLLSVGLGPRTQPEPPPGIGLTECPQAGIKPTSQPQPLDKRPKDKVEQISQNGDEQRTNFEYSCFPHDETSIDVNPLEPRNAVAGANDYRLGWGTSGFYSTTDNGNNWYVQLTPFPSVPGDDHIDGGGDPAIVYDRAGVVYYVQIRFERERDDNGIFVNRSTNGGFTWSRPCVPIGGNPATSPPPHEGAVCGGRGDPRKPGDGTVTYHKDQDNLANFTVPFDDKEYVAAGPRPAGVQPVCFAAVSKTAIECPEDEVGVDRIYVTWTRFEPGGLFGFTARIMMSFSDDQGRSWSPPRSISGSAPFCTFSLTLECDLNQFSVPTVHPTTGVLGVAFQNFNTQDENQYLFVRSNDGGATFEGPYFITPVFDVNYPRVGRNRQDCRARGQGNRNVLTNSCFRVNSGGAVVFDRRTGDFANDLYFVMSDNRNGTPASSNTDVFFFKSTNGGRTWIGPTRVNNDPSQLTGDRDDPSNAGNFGNDQWFPWVDVSEKGAVNVNFYDRRFDTESPVGVGEWPASKTRQGNYLVWRFGGVCSVTTTATVTEETTQIPAGAAECLAPEAAAIPQPTAPIDPGEEEQPGQRQTAFPFKNFNLSDVPSNWDYTFRGGIFAGDYDLVAVGRDGTAWATWTDARNGRSSRNQEGRNPACEQSDAFFETYGAQTGEGLANQHDNVEELFWVTPCPPEIQDAGNISNP